MKFNTLHQNLSDFSEANLTDDGKHEDAEVKFPPGNLNRRRLITLIALRMYTEEEVAEILQVSMSQLRKWRMKHPTGTQQGPPFKKIGRLVRYPQKALQAYINGD